MGALEVNVGFGGAAGDGQAAMADALALVVARSGLHLFAYNSYQSVIRGGHVWLRMRISQEAVETHGDRLDVVVALDADAVKRHASELDAGGVVLFNSDRVKADGLPQGRTALPFPVKALTATLGPQLPVHQNTVLLGGLMHVLGYPIDRLAEALAKQFDGKGEQVVALNVALARAGWEHARKEFAPLAVAGRWAFSTRRRSVMTGNEAMAMGAVAAGCRFFAAYPMTPASGILHWLAPHAVTCGVVVKQAEDEIAVANMTIGAGHAGARAMCATSGGGFALMTEAIGMAGMIEAPAVFVLVMRGGPSTGLPTKTEQGDLNQAFGASQGDYPRVILAPSGVLDCFRTMEEAFNLADRYQLPVIVISDLLLSEHNETVDPDAFDFRFRIDRGQVVTAAPPDGPFLRYRFTADGVSPRALPGTPGTVFHAGTDEHDEKGNLISDVSTHPPTRRRMVDKRGRKLEALRAELPAPALEGPDDAPLTLVGWGSTKGVIREARGLLEARGVRTNHLHVRYLVPFQAREVSPLLERAERTLVIENSASGQFARHLRAETGHDADGLVLKYDGEPFTPREVADAVEGFVKAGGPPGFRHVCETPDASPTAFPRQ
ncbi:MAG: 2-oxoacid:acceptor oxidoreductase subunit alpha [Anaeromyxobacteraceae bacterium]